MGKSALISFKTSGVQSTILTSIQSLLSDPNPASPANSEASRLFSEDRREYNRRVRDIVEQSWVDDSE
eukprot:CAMPEP_0181260910 /NCGR_PEP_ID=MMETSP1097-20121128/1204_1 /TAXON_ID=35684 /ORGANISM="Pseudopedinella elastica, Strain CCMP716" /LENGTH=67 /DNA_ID=CAMNT_0023359473 /DNA_START=72 /DNA_END=275 /DNA_ORIENTATION=-